MVRKSAMTWFVACAVCLPCLSAGPAGAADPPYAIVLRSRNGVVTPERARDAQTGGGFIQVTQLEPNVIMALLRGSAAAGTGHHSLSASMQFELNQDFEIVPTRAGLRPPRLVLAGWLIGALESSACYGGEADHGPASASIQSGGQALLNLSIPPHNVGGGQNLLVNDRIGPLEVPALPGCFVLHQSFAINANQPKTHCHDGAAAAEFDPDPKLDSHWNFVLKPFRAVPHKDFGFRVILRVVEDVPPPVAAAEAPHPPTKLDKEALPLPKPNPVDE